MDERSISFLLTLKHRNPHLRLHCLTNLAMSASYRDGAQEKPRGSKREHAATEALLDQATNAYLLIERVHILCPVSN
jgi:hypothetical protein